MKKLGIVLVGVLLLLPYSVFGAELFTKDLKYGLAKNTEVKRVQEFLRDEGLYKGVITGNYYGLTLLGIKNFQKREGLKQTGKFEGETRELVNSILENKEQLAWLNEWMKSGYTPENSGSAISAPPVNQPIASSVPQPDSPSVPVVVNTPQSPVSTPTTVSPVNQPENKSETIKKEEVKTSTPAISVSSASTTTGPVVPTTVSLSSGLLSNVAVSYPPYYPFYYYVNCSSEPTDNNNDVLTMKVDKTLDQSTVIPGATRADQNYNDNSKNWDIGSISLYNSEKIFDLPFGSPTEAYENLSDFWDKYNKSPRIKSITVKNTGNFDWSSAEVKLFYEPDYVENKNGKPKFVRNFSLPFSKPSVEITASSITKDAATFTFTEPFRFLGGINTNFGIRINVNKMSKTDTVRLELGDIVLENNDPARNYIMNTPDSVGSKTLIKCDRRWP